MVQLRGSEATDADLEWASLAPDARAAIAAWRAAPAPAIACRLETSCPQASIEHAVR